MLWEMNDGLSSMFMGKICSWILKKTECDSDGWVVLSVCCSLLSIIVCRRSQPGSSSSTCQISIWYKERWMNTHSYNPHIYCYRVRCIKFAMTLHASTVNRLNVFDYGPGLLSQLKQQKSWKNWNIMTFARIMSNCPLRQSADKRPIKEGTTSELDTLLHNMA